MSRFSFGRATPRGPMAGGLPQFGGTIPAVKTARAQAKGVAPTPRISNRDKKGYTGSRAGIGHGGEKRTFTLPKGPAGARFASVNLPSRTAPKSAGASRPSLMNRIARRARGFLGL